MSLATGRPAHSGLISVTVEGIPACCVRGCSRHFFDGFDSVSANGVYDNFEGRIHYKNHEIYITEELEQLYIACNI